MKQLSLLIFLLLAIHHLQAQPTLAGRWYSKDSSRIYKVYRTEKGYEAILEESKRVNDKAGELILGDLTYKSGRRIYMGFIRAVTDGMRVQVKIRLKDDGKTMKLKLQRMILFPVYIRWKRAE